MSFDLRAGAINYVPRGPFPADARTRWKNLHRARRMFQRDLDRLARSLKDIPDGPLKTQAVERLIHPPIVFDPLLPGA